MKTIGITEFVKNQVSKEVLEKIDKIREDAQMMLNLFPEDCKQGQYKFSKIIRLFNNFNFESPIVEITGSNTLYIRTDFVARREGEIPYLKRWFDKFSPIKGKIGDHIYVILYSKEQLKKEKTPIKEDFGIVCINIELKNPSPIAPTTMINNHLGIEFGGNGEKLNKKKYLESVEFWKKHALIVK